MLKNETGVTMDPVNLDLLQKLDGLQILIVGPSPRVLLVNHQWKIRVHFTCLWEVKWTEKQHLVESVRMIVDVKRKGGQASTSKVCLIKCPSISHRTACHWSFKSEGCVLNSVMVSSHFLSWGMLQGQWPFLRKPSCWSPVCHFLTAMTSFISPQGFTKFFHNIRCFSQQPHTVSSVSQSCSDH